MREKWAGPGVVSCLWSSTLALGSTLPLLGPASRDPRRKNQHSPIFAMTWASLKLEPWRARVGWTEFVALYIRARSQHLLDLVSLTLLTCILLPIFVVILTPFRNPLVYPPPLPHSRLDIPGRVVGLPSHLSTPSHRALACVGSFRVHFLSLST